MVKFLKVCGIFMLVISCLTFSLVVYGQRSIPDEIVIPSGRQIELSPIFSVSRSAGEKNENGQTSSYCVDVSLLNIIPVKTSRVYTPQRRYVIVGGDIFGLKIYSDGVIIIGTAAVETQQGQKNPAENAGIKKGDILIAIDGVKVNSSSEAAMLFQNCEGREMMLQLMRDNKEIFLAFTPVLSVTDGKYKAGLWIRDSAAGIGTVTYTDPSTGIYGSLGHAVCDTDTEGIIPINNGEAVTAVITGCYKGTKGKAGELCGVFGSKRFGSILINGECGAYGEVDSVDLSDELVPVACSSEVKTGKAQIISTISGSEKKYYDIEIIKIDSDNAGGKNLSIKVTDKQLIEQTGGIVQGMSGSPIIQNGMLVGAVTHVFVSDALRGYGIFADTMLSISDGLYESMRLQDAA